jgi:hypothetical protein
MSDPVTDSRLRPYQGVSPKPSNGNSSPSHEAYEDPRTAPATTQQAYVPQPYRSPSPVSPPSPPASPVSALGHEPHSPWENVPLPPYSAPSPPPPQASLPPGQPPAASDAPKSGLHRALDAIRSTLPLVQKILPLIDGNFATAVGALMAPHTHPTPPPPPVVHVDLEPMERGLAEVRNSHRELRGQVQEQVTTLKHVEDQLERVREATDRNTLEQQELVEDLRSVGSRVSILAILCLVLLIGSLGLNIYLIVQLQHILR